MINVYNGANNVYRFGSYDEYSLPPGCQPLDQANWLSCESASILHPSEWVSTSVQIGYTVPFTSVHAGKYRQKTNQKQTVLKLSTTQKKHTT